MASLSDRPLSIRPAASQEIPDIMRIYEKARCFMRENGNPDQWPDGYPSRAFLEVALKEHELYVVKADGVVHGVFTFFLHPDPTYAVLQEGAWLSNEAYGTLHLIAGDGEIHGLFGAVVAFADSVTPHLRVDTHPDNKVMQHVVTKAGFQCCGSIRLPDGAPRYVYEKL